ncbi:MAG: hypothetical protein ABL886_02205 [Rhodoglobus sp.]
MRLLPAVLSSTVSLGTELGLLRRVPAGWSLDAHRGSMQEAMFVLIPPGSQTFRILVRALPIDIDAVDPAETMSDWLGHIIATRPWLTPPRAVTLPFPSEPSAGCMVGETVEGPEFACGVIRGKSIVYAEGMGLRTHDASEIGGIGTLYWIAESAEDFVY